MGREPPRSVEGLLAQALAHMLKSQTSPRTPYVAAWHAEARRFRDEAASRFAPSMRDDLLSTEDRAGGP